ncbi:TetR-like C-terminal domain-containing protein [Calidifontibacter indicus]|uniref:TetR-like C-terminal domain-containing protein n=1 Tax=Calidifontibacter indicus TaxID=419650 RepID=UPI003D75BF0B
MRPPIPESTGATGALTEADGDSSMADIGVVYVRFALDHRAHFEVMFRPELYDASDPLVVESGAKARQALSETARRAGTFGTASEEEVELGAWALVHGFAALFTTGAIEPGSADEVERRVRAAAGLMFRE